MPPKTLKTFQTQYGIKPDRKRRARPVESFPAAFQEWITQAALHGEVRLPVDGKDVRAGWLMLELRRFIRSVLDSNHKFKAEAGAVMVLVEGTRAVRIVRRDRNLATIKPEVVKHAIPDPLGWVEGGRRDPIAELSGEPEGAPWVAESTEEAE